jgi:hypothetical protein
VKAEFVPGERGAVPEFEDQQKRDENDAGGENKRDDARDLIAFAKLAEKGTRARDGARVRNCCGRGCQLGLPVLPRYLLFGFVVPHPNCRY